MNTPETKEEALEMLSTMDEQADGLREFIKNFGKKKPITERCTSVRAAFEIEGEDYDDFLDRCKKAKMSDISVAAEEIAMFAKVLNEGGEPDYSNSNEYKYFPWFNMSSGFSFHDVLSTYSGSGTAARHVFKTDALARFAAGAILETYRRFYKS